MHKAKSRLQTEFHLCKFQRVLIAIFVFLSLLTLSVKSLTDSGKQKDGFIIRAAEVKEESKNIEGMVSYYTIDGCLGCNPTRMTASGEILDDTKSTLAIPAEWRKQIPMGTMVRVTNLDNGLSVIAKVNDTGGFLKYDRIADLSLAACQAVKCQTDVSQIEIELLSL